MSESTDTKKTSKREQIIHLEEVANDERTSIPERLAVIYEIYRLRGIEIPGYIEQGKAV